MARRGIEQAITRVVPQAQYDKKKKTDQDDWAMPPVNPKLRDWRVWSADHVEDKTNQTEPLHWRTKK